jgi:hypothetical protein
MARTDRRLEIQIAGSSNSGLSPEINPERTINMYIIVDPATGERKLISTPGFRIQKEQSGNEGRALFVRSKSASTKMYSVEDNEVYFYDSSLLRSKITSTSLATISGYIGIADNNANQIFFVDGVDGYIWNEATTTWSTISSGGFPSTPLDATFLDGYFITAKQDTNEFFISALNDGLTWDALRNRGILESEGDIIVAIRKRGNRLFLFGRRNTEILENVGASDFPFRIIKNETMEFGCAAIGSVREGFGQIFWLADDRDGASLLVKSGGSTPSRISNRAFEYAVSTYTNKEDARAILFQSNGQIFYMINFETDNATWLYNDTSKSLTEMQELDGSRVRAQAHAVFKNVDYMLAYNDGNLYSIDETYNKHGLDFVSRIIIPRPITFPNGEKGRINRIMLDMASDVGTSDILSKDPEFFLSIAKDNATQFGFRVKADGGKIGERRKQVMWRGLGSARKFVPKFEFSQDGKLILHKMVIDYDILK